MEGIAAMHMIQLDNTADVYVLKNLVNDANRCIIGYNLVDS